PAMMRVPASPDHGIRVPHGGAPTTGAAMEITREGPATTPGPADWFTGTVLIDSIAEPADGSRLAAASVHFAPGARTSWHTHPHGQTIWVTEGEGRAQRRGGP